MRRALFPHFRHYAIRPPPAQALPSDCYEDAALGCLQPLIARIAMALSARQPAGFRGKALLKQALQVGILRRL